MADSKIVIRVIRRLGQEYSKKGDMDFGNAKDTLIAVLLSAQTTDKQVLKIYPAFQKQFPTWKSLSEADVREIEKSIHTIGLYRSKARAIKKMAKMIRDEFKGRVPATMEKLVTLPGVGRKTASCVLTYVFHEPAIAVDTHVSRIAHRLGWAKGNTPEKVEKELMALVPKKEWMEINRVFVQFGRDVCVGGKKPKCWKCPVAKWCPYESKIGEPER
ncbi:MAG: endonuclease III [bacterium]|nr:endonuclease III [bacterium]